MINRVPLTPRARNPTLERQVCSHIYACHYASDKKILQTLLDGKTANLWRRIGKDDLTHSTNPAALLCLRNTSRIVQNRGAISRYLLKCSKGGQPHCHRSPRPVSTTRSSHGRTSSTIIVSQILRSSLLWTRCYDLP